MANGHGGARKGAGRPKGSKGKKTKIDDFVADVTETMVPGAAKEMLPDHAITPLQYLLYLVNTKGAPRKLRFEAAKAAAPYLHPRLSHAEVIQDITGELKTTVINAQPEMSADEWQQKHAPKTSSGDRKPAPKPH